MLGNWLIQKMPPKGQVAFLYIVLPVILFIRYLFGTFSGLMLFSLSMYLYMWNFGDTRPYTVTQLLLWIDSLSLDYKTAVLSSMLTVFGFLIAFHSTSSNWKAEALAKLRAEVAEEIESFFNEAARLSTDLLIFTKSVVDAVNKFHVNPASREAIFLLERVIENTNRFLEIRDRLGAMTVEAPRILGRNFAVICGVTGAKQNLDDAIEAFTALATERWIFIPIIQVEHTTADQYVSQIDIQSCERYIAAYNEYYNVMNGFSGGIRGRLLYAITGFNLSSLLSIGNRKLVLEALTIARKSKKK